MLKIFFELKKMKIFIDLKGVPTEELEDYKFQSDFAFLVDITSLLNNLNFNLQAPNQLIYFLLSHFKSFELMLHLLIARLKKNVLIIFLN